MMNELDFFTESPTTQRLPSLPDALASDQRQLAYGLMTDFEVLEIYRKNPSSHRGQDMLQELLRRHRNLLRKISWKMSLKHSRSHTFDDFMQHSYVGAIVAYNRFDFSKSRDGANKLSSYVHFTVEKYLLDAMNHDSFIHCPSHKRAMRSYLSGKYDDRPDKKTAFEEQNGLTTESARDQARDKYRGLMPEITSLDAGMQSYKHRGNGEENMFSYMDFVQLEDSDFETDVVQKLDIERAIRQLTPRQQMICKLVMQEQHTNQETAAILSKRMRQTVTEGMVRSDIRAIRQTLRATI